jgi:hypothetical protein
MSLIDFRNAALAALTSTKISSNNSPLYLILEVPGCLFYSRSTI